MFRQSRPWKDIKRKIESYLNRGFCFLADAPEQAGACSGRHVTNAGPGESWHNFGEAFDAVPLIGGKPGWNYIHAKKNKSLREPSTLEVLTMAGKAREQVLALLAKEWEFSGPPGIMDLSEIVAALPLAPSEALAAVKELFVAGLVDMNPLKTSVFLTPEGYATVEQKRRID